MPGTDLINAVLGHTFSPRFVIIGLLGKLLGPAGWILALRSGEWPLRTLTVIMFNDLIWWVPFAFFLFDGTQAATRLRASAPYVCAPLNFAALLAMVTLLRPGTEIVALVAAPARSNVIEFPTTTAL